jgi:hypothetical protein
VTWLYKFAGGALALVALLWAGKCQIERAARNAVEREQRVDSLTRQVKRTDSVFVVDTINLRELRTRYDTERRTIYDTLRRQLVLTDTVRVRRTLELADSTIRSCTDAVNSCAATIKARDELIEELRKPPTVRRLAYSTTLAYDPLTKTLAFRGGPELRLFGGFHLVGEGELRQSATAGETGIRGALRVGVRKTF